MVRERRGLVQGLNHLLVTLKQVDGVGGWGVERLRGCCEGVETGIKLILRKIKEEKRKGIKGVGITLGLIGRCEGVHVACR